MKVSSFYYNTFLFLFNDIMDWGGTTTSANATGSHLDMRSMAQALHDDLSQVHLERESVRALTFIWWISVTQQ